MDAVLGVCRLGSALIVPLLEGVSLADTAARLMPGSDALADGNSDEEALTLPLSLNVPVSEGESAPVALTLPLLLGPMVAVPLWELDGVPD